MNLKKCQKGQREEGCAVDNKKENPWLNKASEKAGMKKKREVDEGSTGFGVSAADLN